MRVLLVEDEKDTREVLASLLRGAGHDVVEAADGAVALTMLIGNGIDFVITDLAMPLMDGIAFVVKAREAGVKCPIGVISAYYPDDKPIDGANFVMHKPVDPEKLIQVLERVAGRVLRW